MNDPRKTILAVGAHAGDMEVSCGAVLAKHARLGDSVTMLHLTLGEGGNPSLPPERYGDQKQREARSIGSAIGASVMIGPYKDGQLPDDEEVRLYVADCIRQVKPTHIVRHWRTSIHKDHARAHTIVQDAVLLASLEGVVTDHPRHRGVRSIVFAENWEDPEGFQPYLYVDVSDDFERWREWVVTYQFVRGGISSFDYLDYYSSLARVRGALIGKRYAIAFDVDPFEKKVVSEGLP